MRGSLFFRVVMLLGLFVWCWPVFAEESPAPPIQNVADLPTELIQFNSKVDDMLIGGGGKFLIVHLPKENLLVRIDVAAGKRDKSIASPAAKLLMAANSEKLFLVLPNEGVIQRYDLESLERDLTAPLPDIFPPLSITTGHAAKEPLLFVSQVGNQGKMTFLDPTTLEPVALTNASKNKATFHRDPGCHLAAAANGRVFVSIDRSPGASHGWSLLRLQGNTYEIAEKKLESYNELVTPSADGERILSQHGITNNEAEMLQAEKKFDSRVYFLPSVTGNYQLRLYQGDFGAKEPELSESTAQFSERGEERPFLKLKLQIPYPPHTERATAKLQTDKRLLFFPEQKRLVTLEERSDRLKLVKLDIEALPKPRTRPQFEIVSESIPLAVPGQLWQHQLNIKADAQPAVLTLSDGPPGMTVTPQGAIAWKVPADMPRESTAILHLKDAKGHELYHNLRIFRSEPATVRTGIAKLAPAQFAGESTTLKLPGEGKQLIPGGGGRYLVTSLPKLKRLALIDLVDVKIVGYLPLDADDFRFGASADKLLVANNDKQTLTRYSLPDLKEEQSVPVELPVGAVVVGHASNGPFILYPKSDDHHPLRFDVLAKGSMFFDLATLKQLSFEFNESQNTWRGRDVFAPFIRCSANGKLFCLGEGKSVAVNGEELHFGIKPYLVREAYYGWPNADGSVLYSKTWRITPRMQQRFETYGEDRAQVLIPALEGRLYLSILRQEFENGLPSSPEQIAYVYQEGSSLPLATLPRRVYLPPKFSGGALSDLILPDQQLAFVPAAKVIVNFNSKRDELNFYRFDLAALLAETKPPLYVTSVPPQRIEPGEKLNYQIQAESKQGGVRYELEKGPPGMTIDSGARVQWTAPPRAPRPMNEHPHLTEPVFDKSGLDQGPKPTPNHEELIKITVTDNSGQKIMHSFSLITDDPEPKYIAGKPKPVVVAAEVPKPVAPVKKPPSLLEQARQSLEDYYRLDGDKQPKKSAPRQPRELPQARPQLPADSFQKEERKPSAPEATKQDSPDPLREKILNELNAARAKQQELEARPAQHAADKIGVSRSWTDATSGKSVEGVFLGISDRRVNVRYTTGREVAIPLDRLSRDDLLWLLQPATPANPAATP